MAEDVAESADVGEHSDIFILWNDLARLLGEVRAGGRALIDELTHFDCLSLSRSASIASAAS